MTKRLLLVSNLSLSVFLEPYRQDYQWNYRWFHPVQAVYWIPNRQSWECLAWKVYLLVLCHDGLFPFFQHGTLLLASAQTMVPHLAMIGQCDPRVFRLHSTNRRDICLVPQRWAQWIRWYFCVLSSKELLLLAEVNVLVSHYERICCDEWSSLRLPRDTEHCDHDRPFRTGLIRSIRQANSRTSVLVPYGNLPTFKFTDYYRAVSIGNTLSNLAKKSGVLERLFLLDSTQLEYIDYGAPIHQLLGDNQVSEAIFSLWADVVWAASVWLLLPIVEQSFRSADEW